MNGPAIRAASGALLRCLLWTVVLLAPHARICAQAPAFTRNPTNLNVARGMDASFTAIASGSPTPVIRWQRDGVWLDRPAGTLLRLTNVQPTDAGAYVAIASNSVNVATSTPALLVLGPVRVWGTWDPRFGLVPVPFHLDRVTAVAAGGSHIAALRPDGRVVTWGLGNVATSVPPDLDHVISLAAGPGRTVALRLEGNVVEWGNAGQNPVPEGLSHVVAVDTGRDFVMALRADGHVISWGSASIERATRQAHVTDARSIAAGHAHCLAIRRQGSVLGWGSSPGSLDVLATQVPLDLIDVVAIDAGSAFSLALRWDGTVVAWGVGAATNVPVGLNRVVGICAGYSHALAIREDGTVVAWGGTAVVPGALQNAVSVAASGSSTVFSVSAEGEGHPWIGSQPEDQQALWGKPVRLAALAAGMEPSSGQWFKDGEALAGQTEPRLELVSMAPEHSGLYWLVASNTLGVATSRVAQITGRPRLSVAAWGLNGHGQLEAPPDLGPVKAFSAGPTHAVALLEDGRVVAWGDATYGATTVPSFGRKVEAIAAGYRGAVALLEDRTTVGWGAISVHSGPSVNYCASVVAGPGPVASNTGWAAGIDTDGRGVVWGNTPYINLSAIQNATNLSALALGRTHAVGLTLDGRVLAWGDNRDGQTNLPPDLTNVVGIAAGYSHSLAVTADGRVLAWGDNTVGQTNVPTDLTNATAIAAGDFHSLALRADGTVTAWGRNPFGQSSVPPNLSHVVAIAAGGSSSYALVAEGPPQIALQPRGRTVLPGQPVELHCVAVGSPPLAYQWCREGTDLVGATNNALAFPAMNASLTGNYHVVVTGPEGNTTSAVARLDVGPLIAWGNNAFEQSWIPEGVTDPIAASAGFRYSLALQSSGAVAVWGDLPPVPSDLAGCREVSAGYGHVLALHHDGTVSAWGQPWLTPEILEVPPHLANAMAVAAGEDFSLALQRDGHVVGWGNPWYQGHGPADIPPGLDGVLAIAAGRQHALALKATGTVVLWGYAGAGTNSVQSGLHDIVAVSGSGTGDFHALTANGQLLIISETAGLMAAQTATNLSEVVAIASAWGGCLALLQNGTVAVRRDYGGDFEADLPPGLSNVIRIGAGTGTRLAVVGDGRPSFPTPQLRRVIRAGGTATLAALAAGQPPLSYQWQFNGSDLAGATNATLAVSATTPDVAGAYRCVVSNALGTEASPATTVEIALPEAPAFDTAPDAMVWDATGLRLRLLDLAGRGPVHLLMSTNLVDWEIVATQPAATGTVELTDPDAAQHTTRFYRASEGP